MRRQTRRTFLATVGAAGAAGLAGCSAFGSDDSSTTSTKSTTKKGDGKGTTSTKGGNDTTTNDGGNQQSGPETFESFEKLGNWSATSGQGSLKKSTKVKYEGSQSAHITGSKKTKYGQIKRVNFGSNPADLSDKNLSIAYKCTSHKESKVDIELYAPDRGHIVTLKRTLYGPKGKWVRINLGVTNQMDPKKIDLSKIYGIRITGRPRDPNTTTPIEFYVDDLKTVPAPEKGMVMLTFDDGAESQYSVAYKKYMKKYGFPGVDAIITDAVFDDGYLNRTQMNEMVGDGWDMISHPNTGAKSMDQRSRKNQEQLMKESQQWLKQYGYEGYKYMAVPKNVVGADTFELAKKYYDVTMTFGGSPNALPVIKKNTLISRAYGDSSVKTSKQLIDYAARYKQLTPLLFHRIGGDEGFSEKKFKAILDHIKKSNVEVVTLSDLEKKGMII
ncbi:MULTISPECIES: polysaccharide deacetylase family protein [unclassified Haladaptatus]|uniref:polysaccharide deacetylase family protein n=1 Tax=unclassified Haladaptatus TaxID=2622732 RepID=UPI00209BF8A8|nr:MULTISPECIES: polysaccharide deacetylase family protein [unclassified Haladaptatus]MCO8247115.1 polysaccharide deacetylase family protein [Haladaptatus sp. AB643]MCO8256618.1 polysaccharide deacetylase family protein [Haladaptatus sp. AB618]